MFTIFLKTIFIIGSVWPSLALYRPPPPISGYRPDELYSSDEFEYDQMPEVLLQSSSSSNTSRASGKQLRNFLYARLTTNEREFIELSPEEKADSSQIGLVEMIELPQIHGKGIGIMQAELIAGAVTLIGGVITPIVGIVTSIIDSLVSVGQLALEVGKWVEEMIERKEAREGFLRGLLYSIQYQTENLCNCLVANLNKAHEVKLSKWVYFQAYHFERTTFGVWVVEGGYYRNKDMIKGDKWGWAGDAYIDGFWKDRLNFHNRPCVKHPSPPPPIQTGPPVIIVPT